ncbi:MAG: methyl-accepting chemotaxis protein [Pseudomonadota bacterium]
MKQFKASLNHLAAKLSIRVLVITLAMISVITCILLGITAILSTEQLAQVKASLARVSTIQQSSANIVESLGSFQQRKAEILASKDSDSLVQLGDKTQLLAQFNKANESLRPLVADDQTLSQYLDALNIEFGNFLDVDKALYHNMRQIVGDNESVVDSQQKLNQQLNAIDTLIGEISGKVTFAEKRQNRKIKRLVKKINNPDTEFDFSLYQGLVDESSNMLLSDNTIYSATVDRIKFDYLGLAALSREVVNIQSGDRLVSLRKNKIDQRIESMNKSLADLQKISNNDDTRQRYSQLKTRIDDYFALAFLGSSSLYSLKEKIIDHQKQQQVLDASFYDVSAKMNAIVGNITERVAAEREKISTQAFQQVGQNKRSILLQTIFAAVFLLLVSFALVRIINAPLKQIATALNEIASGDGDLTQRLETASVKEVSSIALAFNLFVEKISSTIKQVNDSSRKLLLSAEDLEALSNSAKADAQAQQSETGKAALSVSETAKAADSIAKTTEETRLSSDDVRKQASEGDQMVENVGVTIEKLATVIDQSKSSISALDKTGAEITSVMDVIRGIAEQTNLLALNAAIEAARAGETGRGFAVVADEVRSLASRTQQSTIEIEEMIKQLQSGTQQSVSLIQEGDQVVEQTVEKAKLASHSLKKIIDSIVTVSESNTLIASAAEEQSLIAQKVTVSVNELKEIGERSTQNTEKITCSAKDLAAISTELNRLMQQFKI